MHVPAPPPPRLKGFDPGYLKAAMIVPFALCLGCATREGPSTHLPSGWGLMPAGKMVQLQGDMPLKIAAAPDGKAVLVATGGFHDHAVDVVDPAAGKVLQHLAMGKVSAGLAVGAGDDRIYVSGGDAPPEDLKEQPEIATLPALIGDSLGHPIPTLTLAQNGSLQPAAPLDIPGLAEKNRFIGGLAVDRAGGRLFAANVNTDTVYAIDPQSARVLATTTVGYRPYQLALSPDRGTLAVANWGDRSVSLLSGADLKLISKVEVGVHPTDLTFGPDGRLFVANAGSNSVSVIEGGRVAETVMTSLHPDDPVGSTPDALAVGPDGTKLYVANADNNDIAAIDISRPNHSAVLGFIPTGWYPSALAIAPDGRSLVVGIAKGAASRPNYPAQLAGKSMGAWNPDPSAPFDYVGNAMSGLVEIVPLPDAGQLADYTKQVAANFPVVEPSVTASDRAQGEAAFRRIKHVLYIIRENRSYDQVLGDDPRGDGEPKLAIFGRSTTPNGHRLAELTPLMDRYFLNGEVSEDGHQWADAAYVTAFTERGTASGYGGRGEPDADDRLTASPAGYLWDAARRRGLGYYSYGEFADFKSNPNTPPTFEGDRGLEGHASSQWGVLNETFWKGFRKGRDPEKAELFIADLKRAEESGNWPSLMIMSLPEDHTGGLTAGRPTPRAMVASNDLAFGKIVEAVSHSKFWDSTAIFVTEDDAQNGPDHVDDHRSVGLVISPYAKPGLVDHTHYTMMSMVRTIELILGLPPMSQYDRGATPMYRLFQAEPRHWTYTIVPETQDLNAINPQTGKLAEASQKLDFSAQDRADPQALNMILWAALKPGDPMPAPVRSAYGGTAWEASLKEPVRSGSRRR